MEEEAPETPVAGIGPETPLLDGLDALLEGWIERVEAELTGPIRDVLIQARDAHRAALDGAGLDPTENTSEPDFETLRDYRKAMHRSVVQPILRLAEEVDPATRAPALVDSLLEGMLGVAGEAPASVRRAAPPGPVPVVRGGRRLPGRAQGRLRRGIQGRGLPAP